MLNQISPILIKNGICYHSEENVAFANPPVYEVIRVIDGIPLYFNEHVERLFASLDLIQAKTSLSRALLSSAIDTLVKETGLLNNNIRLEVGEDRQGHSIWVLFWVKSHYPDKSVYEQGVKTVTSIVTRENPHAKIFRKNVAEVINAIKQESGAFEVILIKADGTVTEGSRSNLFFISNETLYAATEADVLMGITRQKLLALLERLSITLVEKDIHVDEIDRFEACFITGTSIHLLPVEMIDDIRYNSAKHPLLIKLEAAFENIVKDDLKHTKEAIIR